MESWKQKFYFQGQNPKAEATFYLCTSIYFFHPSTFFQPAYIFFNCAISFFFRARKLRANFVILSVHPFFKLGYLFSSVWPFNLPLQSLFHRETSFFHRADKWRPKTKRANWKKRNRGARKEGFQSHFYYPSSFTLLSDHSRL